MTGKSQAALLRQRVLDERHKLESAKDGQSRLIQMTDEACRRFLESELARHFSWNGRQIGLYRAMPGEPELSRLASQLEKLGARPGYPRIDGAQKGVIEFVEPLPGTDWAPGRLGVLEPTKCIALRPEDLALIVVPGVVFGPAGERLGMGAGFYDRYLPQSPQAVRVAIAFEFQMESSVPQNPWDQRVHWIFTEKRAIRTPLAAAPALP